MAVPFVEFKVVLTGGSGFDEMCRHSEGGFIRLRAQCTLCNPGTLSDDEDEEDRRDITPVLLDLFRTTEPSALCPCLRGDGPPKFGSDGKLLRYSECCLPEMAKRLDLTQPATISKPQPLPHVSSVPQAFGRRGGGARCSTG